MDEDIGVEGLLAGSPACEGPESFQGWLLHRRKDKSSKATDGAALARPRSKKTVRSATRLSTTSEVASWRWANQVCSSKPPWDRRSWLGVECQDESDGFSAWWFPILLLSREENRLHVHVHHTTGEAKFWLEPAIALAQNFGLSQRNIAAALQLVREHEHEIRAAWKKHFPG